jgi:hypothetical protein
MSGDDDEWAVDADGVDDSADQQDDQWDVDADSVGDSADEEDDEWRFSLEDLEDDDGTENGTPEGEDDEVGDNVFGTLQSATEELEPGSPSLENTAFVVLGIVLALLLFAQFILVILGGP